MTERCGTCRVVLEGDVFELCAECKVALCDRCFEEGDMVCVKCDEEQIGEG